MSRFLLIAGVILALLGLAMGIQHFSSPETMQVRGLTFDSAITMITGGLLAMGLGSLLERFGEISSFGTARHDEDAEIVTPAVAAPAVVARSIAVEDKFEAKSDVSDDSDELPALRRFGTSPIAVPPRPAPNSLPDPIAKPSIAAVEAPVVEVAEEITAPVGGSRFRMPSFPRKAEVPAAPITAPPPVAAPVRSAADEALARVPAGVTVTTRKISSQREAASHLIPAVIVRGNEGSSTTTSVRGIAMGTVAGATVAGAAAATGLSTTAISSTGATGKSVAETLDALEQAKTEIRQAFDRAPAVEEDDEMPGPEDDLSDDEDDIEPREGELYVVEEMNVRGRPARLLSDGTVEAETDEGWMRFENMDHLNEYLGVA
jgi:hypothetical protein